MLKLYDFFNELLLERVEEFIIAAIDYKDRHYSLYFCGPLAGTARLDTRKTCSQPVQKAGGF